MSEDLNGWDDRESYLGEALGVCGCGNADKFKIIKELIDLRNARKTSALPYSDYVRQVDFFTDKNKEFLFELALHHLDYMEIMEHGTSVNFCWLTPKGEQVLEALAEYTKETDNGN